MTNASNTHARLMKITGRYLLVLCLSNLFSVSNVALAQGVLDSFTTNGVVRLDTGNAPAMPLVKGPAIVQFWASWCVGCRKNMETIIESTRDSHLQFFTVSLDEDPSAARKYLERAGSLASQISSRTLVDTQQQVATRLKILAVPTTIFIDADGKIVHRITGHASPKDIERMRQQLEPRPDPGVKSSS